MRNERRVIGFDDTHEPIHGEIDLSEQEAEERRQQIIHDGINEFIVQLSGNRNVSLSTGESKYLSEVINLTLNEVSDKQRQIIEARFGLLGDEPLDESELEKRFKLERISGEAQVRNIIRGLRAPGRLDALVSYYSVPDRDSNT